MLSWDNIVTFLNSNFTSALAGALAGAFAGAIAAQRIADRSHRKRQLVEEVRGVNAAIIVAISICNSTINFKKQLVTEVVAEYQRSRQAVLAHNEQIARGSLPRTNVFRFRADFRHIQVPLLPINTLRTQVFDRVAAPSRALALVAALAGSVDGLVDVTSERNRLIEKFKELGEGNSQLPLLYFGLPYGDGHLSTEFFDCIDGINRLTDDVIFFSELLANDLIVYGQKALEGYKKLERKTDLRIPTADFSNVRALGLMPDPANYEDWLKGFKQAT